MKIGIIGYAQSGRSTLYRAASRGMAKGEMTAVPVPDPRFTAIVDQVKPKKATPATVILQDEFEPISSSGKALSQKLLDGLRKTDLLLHVVRAFDNPSSPFHAEIDPIRDLEAVEVELVLADLQIVENRLEKLKKSLTVKNPGSADYMEHALFSKLLPELENGIPIRRVDLSDDEFNLSKNYQFVSGKQMVVAFNVDESEILNLSEKISSRCESLHENGTPALAICASVEEEIAQLDAADQPEFLESLGLTESASDRLIRAVYESLGLITFFTAGDNDTRAWPLRKGSSALKAAGTIHNDIAKGFIRAEIVHYKDYEKSGSLDLAYSQGKMSLEGKDYLIQDGDLIHIRNKS